MIITFWILLIIFFIILFITIRHYHKNMNECNELASDMSYRISHLHKMLEEESGKKEEYHKRVIELEDGIKDGVGVNLRNEVTQVITEFDEQELFQMSEGVKLIIPKVYANIGDVEFCVNLAKKLQKYSATIIKSKQEKEPNV